MTRNTILIVVITFLLSACALADQPVRTWKYPTGDTIFEAAWDSENNPEPETVYFLKDGERYKLPLDQLSEEDQKYVKDGRKGGITSNSNISENEDQILLPFVQPQEVLCFRSFSFTPDGKYLLIDEKLFEIKTGQQVRQYTEDMESSHFINNTEVIGWRDSWHNNKDHVLTTMKRDVYTGKTTETHFKNIRFTEYKNHSMEQYDNRYDDNDAITNQNNTYLLLTDDKKDARNYADIIDLRTGKITRSFKMKYKLGDNPDMALHPDAKSAAFVEEYEIEENSYNKCESLRIYSTSTGALKWEKDFGSKGNIYELTFTRDGKYLTATVSNYEKYNSFDIYDFIVWDAETGREIKVFTVKAVSNLSGITFSPDGEIVALSEDEYLYTYSFSTGQLLREFSPHLRIVNAICFSKDGSMVATCDSNQVFVWNTLTGERIQTIGNGISENDHISVIAVSDDEKTVVMADGPIIKVFNGDTGIIQHLWRAFEGRIISLSLRRDGTEVKIVSEKEEGDTYKQSVKWWSIADGTEIPPQKIPEKEMKTAWNDRPQVIESPDGNYRAGFEIQKSEDSLRTFDKRSRILNLTNVRTGKITKIPIRGFEGREFNRQIEFTEDSRYLVTWENYETKFSDSKYPDEFGRIIFINVQTGEVERQIIEREMAFRSYEGFFFSLTKQGNIILSMNEKVYYWDMETVCPIKMFYWKDVHFRTYESTIHSKKTGQIYKAIQCDYYYHSEMTPDEKLVVMYDTIKYHLMSFMLYSVDDGKPIKSFYITSEKEIHSTDSMSVNEDGSMVAILTHVIERNSQNERIFLYNLLIIDTNREQLLHNIQLSTTKGHNGSQIKWISDSEIEVLRYSNGQSYEERISLTNTPCIYDTVNVNTGKVRSRNSVFPINRKVIKTRIMDEEIEIKYDSLNIMENGKYALYDNSIVDIATGELILKIITFYNGQQWLAVTPEGLFDGTPDARRMVSYRVGETLNVQPVEAFFQDFYYPGLLGAIWKGERPKPSVKVKEQLPPEIQIVSPKSGETESGKVRFEVVVKDQGGGIQKPSITVNGIVLA